MTAAWIIILLILVNALFVLIEMALVSSRRARLETRAERGDRGARVALRLLDSPNLYLSTVQIGITLTGVLMGAYGEETVARSVGEWVAGQYPRLEPYSRGIGLAVTALTLTFCIIVVAELVPKRIAQMAPERLARLGSRPMWIMSRICAPVVWLLSVCTNLILTLVPMRAREGAGSDEEVQQDVKAMIASGRQTGVFHEAEQKIVERVFKLSDKSVKAVMVPRPDIEYLLLDDDAQRVRVVLATSTHSYFPVCKSAAAGLDALVGVVHVKDLMKQALVREELKLSEVVKPPLFVPESTPAIEMLEAFRKQKSHIAFVLDEYGAVEGLVTLYDVLEALVGEVQRQGEVDEPWVVRRDDGSYLLDGMLPVSELRELLGVEKLPQHEIAGYETLGGMVMTFLGRIPAAGDHFEWEGMRFEVMDMDRARVDKVLVARMKSEGASGEAVA